MSLRPKRTAENQRRAAMQSMQRAAQANNEMAQAEAALQGLERENERLAAESETARGELESLGAQRGQVAMNFESVTERLKRLEAEILEAAPDARAEAAGRGAVAPTRR